MLCSYDQQIRAGLVREVEHPLGSSAAQHHVPILAAALQFGIDPLLHPLLIRFGVGDDVRLDHVGYHQECIECCRDPRRHPQRFAGGLGEVDGTYDLRDRNSFGGAANLRCHQNGAPCAMENPVTDRPEECPNPSAAAMGARDDEIRLSILRSAEDRHCRPSDGGFNFMRKIPEDRGDVLLDFAAKSSRVFGRGRTVVTGHRAHEIRRERDWIAVHHGQLRGELPGEQPGVPERWRVGIAHVDRGENVPERGDHDGVLHRHR